ncbi:hypothetical protein QYE76_062885 [Lolium multiflorum]|uniref:Disease resistance protein RPM1 n=1 Tax=Lolium multiflorum TaxID=4521 RepID=A0AAD8UY50_LOLMU|nr:hypothetical protein QYE76_008347 [Lolium multiflorum]KAK1566434.1 hypothetical protein QYE76_017563 [Lolium multiflorum]KAK1645080.1 hypothetical protein QYE76_062885 [Lolium multiflorum]
MGDLAVGFAKTVVEGTLVKAKAAIDEEAKLKQSVQRDLVFITGEFQMMQCFLNSTDEEHAKNSVVKSWVRQLRDLAYDVEDCIEFVVHLDNKSAWWWRMVPSCMAPALPLDQAVADIKELKARVEEVSQRSTRYNVIGDSGSKPVVTQQQLQRQAITSATECDIIVDAKVAAKKQHGLWNLTELINREDADLQVISLWGTAGDLGVKSIISKAYDDPKTCQTFTCRAWVKLVHPFNPKEFIHSLLAQFCACSCQEQRSVIGVDVLKRMRVMATEEDLMNEFVQEISNKRYLIVLEDLSTIVEWGASKMYLPNMKNGSRIIVSTQQFEIASLCTGHPYHISETRQFSVDHSVCVLFKEGSQRDGDKFPGEVGHGVASLPLENYHLFEPEAAQILDILKQVDTEIRRNDKSLAFQVMSVWGIVGLEKTALVRSIYRSQMNFKYSHRWGKYAWVDVPHPLDLEEFYRRLLWDLCSISTQAEHKEYHDSLRQYETFQLRCRHILHTHRCLVVIDSLKSKKDWHVINIALRLGEAKGCTIVITTEESVAMHCADNTSLVCHAKGSGHDAADHIFRDLGSQCDRSKHEGEVSHTVSPLPHDNFDLSGHRSETAQIFNFLQSTDTEIDNPKRDLHVLSVWGIAGVGKTHLVRSIYRSQMKFKYSHRWSKYGWVDVPYPFNLREFSWSLLLELSSKSNDKANEWFHISSIEDPMKECRDILREHRCLIIIDHLQSTEDWDSISTSLALVAGKTRTIVITNEASIAIHCAKIPAFVCSVRSLESDAALQLFKDQTKRSDSDLGPGIMKQVELALNKCGGIPRVIVAFCHFIALFGYMDGLPDMWHLLNAHFMTLLERRADYDGLQGLFDWLHKYFRSCPDFLKPCVFYLPIFPANDNIRRGRLLRRWIAEGYCRDTINATAEQNGKKYINQLIDLSMIQQPPLASKFGKMTTIFCRVNGFFREYIVSQPTEDNMVFALEEHGSQNPQYTGRHLVIKSTWERDENVFERIDFSQLRSLTVFGKWQSFFVSDKMKVLRVLDLEDSSGVTDDEVEKIVKLLFSLKFLSLRGCTNISCLPTSLGNLKQLQTLDVRHTSITILPSTIINLQKLQYIRAGTTEPPSETLPRCRPRTLGSLLPKFCRRGQFSRAHLGVVVPRGMEKMKALHTLGVVNVGVAGSNATLKQIKKLTQLRKLGVTGINRDNIQDFFSAIRSQGSLESLSVRLDKDEQSSFSFADDISGPLNKSLKSLKLYGHVDNLPAWINQFSNILKLDLEMTMFTQEMVYSLPAKYSLKSLRLSVKPIQDGELKFYFGPEKRENWRDFCFLHALEIDCSSRLLLNFREHRLKNLELLIVHCSSGSQISGLAHLKKLNRVFLMGSHDDALKQDLQRQLAEHPNEQKPVLQLEIQLAGHPSEEKPVLQLEDQYAEYRNNEGIPDLEDEVSPDVEEVSTDQYAGYRNNEGIPDLELEELSHDQYAECRNNEGIPDLEEEEVSPDVEADIASM